MSTWSQPGRWFVVRAEFEQVGRPGMAWRTAKEAVLGLITVGLTFGEFDPKRFCDVMIIRRDAGEVVAHYAYARLSEADAHVRYLRSRLGIVHVFDFCRDLGLDPGIVVGPGADFDLCADPLWVPVSRCQRRQPGFPKG